MTKIQLAQRIVQGMYNLDTLPGEKNPNVRSMAEKKKTELEHFYNKLYG